MIFGKPWIIEVSKNHFFNESDHLEISYYVNFLEYLGKGGFMPEDTGISLSEALILQLTHNMTTDCYDRYEFIY